MDNDAVAKWTPTGISGVMLVVMVVMWSSLGGRIDDVQADVRELRGEVSEVRGEMSEISTRVGRIEGILEATAQDRASELTANAQ